MRQHRRRVIDADRVSDPVNAHGGSYRVTGDGFSASDVATTLVGYVGKDPVTLLAVAA